MQQEAAEVQRVGVSGVDREDSFTELLGRIDEAALLQRRRKRDSLVQIELGDRFVGLIGVDQLEVGRLGRFRSRFAGDITRRSGRIGCDGLPNITVRGTRPDVRCGSHVVSIQIRTRNRCPRLPPELR